MKLQTDTKVLAKLAEEHKEANWRFRSFLKSIDLDIEKLDAACTSIAQTPAGHTLTCKRRISSSD